MSKDDCGEVSKFAEWSWFCSIAKQSRLAEQWKGAHRVGKLKRADEHLLVIRGMTRPVKAGRKQVRGEQWNLGRVKAVLNRIQESKANTDIDTSAARQKYMTNQVFDEYSRAQLCKMRLGYRSTLPSTI